MYRAVIIGCGRIGTFFDTPESENVLTHANACLKHPEVELCGVMDIDPGISGKAGERWSCHSFHDVERMLEQEKPDIVTIAAPDEYHYEYLNIVLEYNPKAVVAEKPLTKDRSTSEEIVANYASAGIPLFVNYPRRYDRTVQRLKERIECGKFGQILHATAKYTKGTLHNGSHAVDIARYLFGSVLSVKPLSAVYDYHGTDPTLNAFLSLERCPNFFLVAGDERCYSIFELDIVGEKRRVSYDQFGLRYREHEIRNDPVFDGYKDLEMGASMDSGLGMSMVNLVDNVVNHLEGSEGIICSGADALQSQIVCEKLLAGYTQGVLHA
jgi:predicted dehydrogenase